MSVGSEKCQPIGFIQVVGMEGSVVQLGEKCSMTEEILTGVKAKNERTLT
jgi:hypothetical protein